MKTNINDFNEETCELFHPVMIFNHIHEMTNGDPCTTGCAFYCDGECKGYKDLNKTKIKTHKVPLITNAEIAKDLKCSVRQVSKMRKKDSLPEKYII